MYSDQNQFTNGSSACNGYTNLTNAIENTLQQVGLNGDLDMNNNQINNLPNLQTNQNQAVSLYQLEQYVIQPSQLVPLNAQNVAYPLSNNLDLTQNSYTVLVNNAINSSDATSKSYVDIADQNILSQSETVSQNLVSTQHATDLTLFAPIGNRLDQIQITNPLQNHDLDLTSSTYTGTILVNDATSSKSQSAISYNQWNSINNSLQGQINNKMASNQSVSQISVSNPSTTSLNMNGQKLIQLADPVANQDASTKNFVNNQIGGLSSVYMPISSTLNQTATSNVTTADIPMNSHNFTGMIAGSVSGNAVEYSQYTTNNTNINNSISTAISNNNNNYYNKTTSDSNYMGKTQSLDQINNSNNLQANLDLTKNSYTAICNLPIAQNQIANKSYVDSAIGTINQSKISTSTNNNSVTVLDSTNSTTFINNNAQSLIMDNISIRPSLPIVLNNTLSNTISGVPNCVNNDQVSNKAYVDGQIIVSETYTNTAISNNNNNYYNKTTSDSNYMGKTQSIGQISVANETAQNVDLNSYNIINLKDPTTAQMGATKNYVDTSIQSISAPSLIKNSDSKCQVNCASDNSLQFTLNNSQTLSFQKAIGQLTNPDLITSQDKLQLSSSINSISLYGAQTPLSQPTNNVHGVYIECNDNVNDNVGVQLQLCPSGNTNLNQCLTFGCGHISSLYPSSGGTQLPYSAIYNQAGSVQQNLQFSSGTPTIDCTATLFSDAYVSQFPIQCQFNRSAGYSTTTNITQPNQFCSKTYTDTQDNLRVLITTPLQSITAPTSALSLNNKQITSLASAGTITSGGTIAVNSGDLFNYYPKTTTLDAITSPTSALSLNSKQITNLLSGGTISSTNGANISDVNSIVSTALVPYYTQTQSNTNFMAKSSSLSVIATANPNLASVPMNNFKLTGLPIGTVSGDSVSFQQLANYYLATTPLQSITLASGNLSLNSHQITNLLSAGTIVSGGTNAVNVNDLYTYVQSQSGGLPSNSTLNSIATTNPCTATVSLNFNQISNLNSAGTINSTSKFATNATDLFNYALAKTTTLNNIVQPQANVSMNSFQITSLSSGGVVGSLNTNACSIADLYNFINGNYYPSTYTLNQILAPTASVAFNNQKITGLANGSLSTDSATFGQIGTAISGLSSIYMSISSTLNSIATSNVTTSDIPMNSHNFTGMSAGTITGSGVEYSQLQTQLGGYYTKTQSDANYQPLSWSLATQASNYASLQSITASNQRIINLSPGVAGSDAVCVSQIPSISQSAIEYIVFQSTGGISSTGIMTSSNCWNTSLCINKQNGNLSNFSTSSGTVQLNANGSTYKISCFGELYNTSSYTEWQLQNASNQPFLTQFGVTNESSNFTISSTSSHNSQSAGQQWLITPTTTIVLHLNLIGCNTAPNIMRMLFFSVEVIGYNQVLQSNSINSSGIIPNQNINMQGSGYTIQVIDPVSNYDCVNLEYFNAHGGSTPSLIEYSSSINATKLSALSTLLQSNQILDMGGKVIQNCGQATASGQCVIYDQFINASYSLIQNNGSQLKLTSGNLCQLLNPSSQQILNIDVGSSRGFFDIFTNNFNITTTGSNTLLTLQQGTSSQVGASFQTSLAINSSIQTSGIGFQVDYSVCNSSNIVSAFTGNSASQYYFNTVNLSHLYSGNYCQIGLVGQTGTSGNIPLLSINGLNRLSSSQTEALVVYNHGGTSEIVSHFNGQINAYQYNVLIVPSERVLKKYIQIPTYQDYDKITYYNYFYDQEACHARDINDAQFGIQYGCIEDELPLSLQCTTEDGKCRSYDKTKLRDTITGFHQERIKQLQKQNDDQQIQLNAQYQLIQNMQFQIQQLQTLMQKMATQ